ncbi:hypothetical protein AA14362_2567 [Acetobacter cerevisiae DSM 14362]|nr:hypothetical protein AA14362_2567 [Acetobacter cerevisiae DSM 14362]
MTTSASASKTDARLPRDVSFHEEDWLILASYWYPVALVRELEEKPLGVTLLDAPLVLYRAGNEIVIADDLCPIVACPSVWVREMDRPWPVPITASSLACMAGV